MAESNERAQSWVFNSPKREDLNTFQEETYSKTVEKEDVIGEVCEIDLKSTSGSIVNSIDETISNIQATAGMAVANLMEGSAISTGGVKPCNLDIEAALNNTLETIGGEVSSSDVDQRVSRNECQLAAEIANNMSRDARLVGSMGEKLMENIFSTIQILQSHICAFQEKALEASEHGTERGYSVADFYHNMVSKYESAVEVLERKAKTIELTLSRVQEAANKCQRYAELAEGITDETLEESIRTKLSTCWWTNKGKAAIIVCLKKEHSALLMMRRIWNNVRNDMEYKDISEDSDVETQQQCQNRNRNTKIGHIITTFLGLCLLSIIGFFKAGSDSFYAVLTLGLLTTGWCAMYWSHKFYMFLKERENHETSKAAAEHQDGFLENCERRLAIVRIHLLKYNIVVDSDAESDTDSVETAAVGNDSQ